MKKRFLAFLLAVCVAVSMLVLPASAVGSNAAVQTATALGGLTAGQAGSLGAPLTRGQAARLLTAFSAYRDTTTAQGRTGRLYSDVDSDSPYAVYIRTAVQNGWMTGYSDGSFRPDNTVTLEEACTMALRLLGYDVAKLGGTFPTAQLSKAGALGLRNEIDARQGETLTLEQGTMLFYNALTAMNGSGQVYASTLGFAVNNGQVDISSVLLDNVKGPFVADASTVLPFAPAAIYRNDEVTTSAALSLYDVYYYNESARTVWLYNKRAAGRVTAVSPSASAPTSVTVAGVSYTIASPSVAYQLSSLSGGGVGQVVTLLLGMNDAAVSVLTGDAADAVFYGVVQSSSRTLVETNSAEVQQAVSVMCTDGTARTVNVNNKLNFPAGKLVEISVDGDGERGRRERADEDRCHHAARQHQRQAERQGRDLHHAERGRDGDADRLGDVPPFAGARRQQGLCLDRAGQCRHDRKRRLHGVRQHRQRQRDGEPRHCVGHHPRDGDGARPAHTRRL